MGLKIKVLQLASFTGNIGDNANHSGTRAFFSERLPYDFEYTDLEIRQFFWGQRQWDLDLVHYINQFDLLIIGGGNFFELWVEDSRTGCSIDLPPELLEKIHCPILFYGLGVDAGQGIPATCQQRFERFLTYLLENERCCVAVRNDGAAATLEQHFTGLPFDRVLHVPDGGFFYPVVLSDKNSIAAGILGSEKTIAINIAGDMLETRFPARNEVDNPYIDYKGFNRQFAEVLTTLLKEHNNHNLILVPHIWRDLDAISKLLNEMPDNLRRQRVQVAPYLTGFLGANILFNLYRRAGLCLSVRFHANVCPIALARPTIGLANYPQINHLYRELSLEEQLVDVNLKGFQQQLYAKSEAALCNPQVMLDNQNRVMEKLCIEARSTLYTVEHWMSQFFN